MRMKLAQELVLDEVEEYVEFSNDILSAKLVLDRTHEIVIKFTPNYIIDQVNKLLKLNIWLNYEKKTLEMLKHLLVSSKGKEKFHFTKIKIGDFIKFSKYAFEASIERADWVKNKILDRSLEKVYSEYVSMILFILNQNIINLKKIKEIEPKNKEEAVKEVKKIIKFGPLIQENILDTYILIKEKSEEKEIAQGILDKTLECVDKYSSFDEI